MTREQIDQIIAQGGINPQRDTVYRVGSDSPEGYFTQSQLNNAMSGTDANAIFQATHDQSLDRTVNDRSRQAAEREYDWYSGAHDPDKNIMLNMEQNRFGSEYGLVPNNKLTLADFLRMGGGNAYNNRMRNEGYKPYTGQQYLSYETDMDNPGAYVTGADAWMAPEMDETLLQGLGSSQGIPQEYLNKDATRQLYADTLRRMWEEKGYNAPTM